MTPDQIRDRGIRAGNAMDDFLAPSIEKLRAEYLSALTKLAANEPWETAKITKLAIAQRVIDTVEQQMRAMIIQGREAASEIDRAKAISEIPEAKRRFLRT